MKGGIFSGNNYIAATPRQRRRKHSRGYLWLSGLWEKSRKDGGREIHIFLWVRPGHGSRRVSFWQRPATRSRQAGNKRRVLSDPSILLSRRDYARRSKSNKLCVGRRAATLSLSRHTPTSSISTHTFTTILLPLTVPGSFATSGARPSPCGGSLTVCVWKTGSPSWKIPSPGARASFAIMGSGRLNRKSLWPIDPGFQNTW